MQISPNGLYFYAGNDLRSPLCGAGALARDVARLVIDPFRDEITRQCSFVTDKAHPLSYS
jgi:hypothetical protein